MSDVEVEDDIGPLFADEDDGEFDLPPPLPPLEGFEDNGPLELDMDGGAADDGEEGKEGDAKNESTTTEKRKRIVRNQPKLDSTRLCDPSRGMPFLVKDFKRLHYRGKGHEASDLKMLMKQYEHWAHRLFPKLPFRDVVGVIENSLSAKKEVKVCLTRLRRGQDMVTEIEDENVNGLTGTEDNGSAFGEGLRGSQTQQDPGYTVVTTTTDVAGVDRHAVSLTDEQRERIRRMREAAQARRAAREAERRKERAVQEQDGGGDSSLPRDQDLVETGEDGLASRQEADVEALGKPLSSESEP